MPPPRSDTVPFSPLMPIASRSASQTCRQARTHRARSSPMHLDRVSGSRCGIPSCALEACCISCFPKRRSANYALRKTHPCLATLDFQCFSIASSHSVRDANGSSSAQRVVQKSLLTRGTSASGVEIERCFESCCGSTACFSLRMTPVARTAGRSRSDSPMVPLS